MMTLDTVHLLLLHYILEHHRTELKARVSYMSALNVKPVKSTPLPRRQRPTVSGWEAEYIPSKNGDANLLIMFHGLGTSLGRSS